MLGNLDGSTTTQLLPKEPFLTEPELALALRGCKKAVSATASKVHALAESLCEAAGPYRATPGSQYHVVKLESTGTGDMPVGLGHQGRPITAKLPAQR